MRRLLDFVIVYATDVAIWVIDRLAAKPHPKGD